MPSKLGGTYTLLEAIQETRRHARSRLDNMKRDVLRKIQFNVVRTYDPDRLTAPTIKYEVISFSYPQYGKYLTATGKSPTQRKQRKYQRTIRHEYQTILQFGEDGLSLYTNKWKCRVGSGRKWEGRKPPQNQIHQIYTETVDRWKTMFSPEEVKRKKVEHRKKRYKYVDVGDYLSQQFGIMMDFSIRLAYVYRKHNHLYGYCYGSDTPPNVRNPQQRFFLTKHTLRLIDALGRLGYIDSGVLESEFGGGT